MAIPKTIIVGAGHAGGRAAEALRAADPARDIVLIGEETHPPYERPSLSKDLLLGTASAEATYLFPEDWYAARNIRLLRGNSVKSIDRQAKTVILTDGEIEPYEQLLLATGAKPRVLNLPNIPAQSVLYLRTIEDCLALRGQLVAGCRLGIIGAGFIGLEVAAAARMRGCAVTVIEAAPQALGRVVDARIGRWMSHVHETRGVTMRLGTGLSRIDQTPAGTVLGLSDGSELAVDLVVAGIGAVPNVELAQAAGLETRDGILSDAFGRTSDPTIWAAGDCTRHFNPLHGGHLRLETWHNAQNQAMAVARAMAGGSEPYAEIPWFWSDQYGLRLQSLGFPAGDAPTFLRGSIESGDFIAFAMHEGRIINAKGAGRAKEFAAVRHVMAARRLLDPESLTDDATDLPALARSLRGAARSSVPV